MPDAPTPTPADAVPAERTEDLSLALHLADIADEISTARFRATDLRVETKPDLTPVSDADRAVETAIRSKLAELRPGDGIVGEEFGADSPKTGRRWVVDPIDATKNFVRGVPVWATLIALMDGPQVLRRGRERARPWPSVVGRTGSRQLDVALWGRSTTQ